jgi:hypothetical protein
MATLPVLLFLAPSGGRSAKCKWKKNIFSIKIIDIQPGN